MKKIFSCIMLAFGVSLYGARPIAHWDVVPYQLIEKNFKIGVVAFHEDGVQVEFKVNGQTVYVAENPTFNERTGVWEYWFELDPSKYADGELLIDAQAICLKNSPENPAYNLPALTLYANSGQTLGSEVISWADSVNGSDSNDGSKEFPYKTLKKAVSSTPAGGTVYLKAGVYESDGLGGGSRPYWTTIAAAPGLSWDDVKIGPGRPGTQRLKLKNISLVTDNESGKYATILTGENGRNIVWLDNCKAYNIKGRYAAGTIVLGNRYSAYITGGLYTEMANGPGARLIRNMQLKNITSDAWTGSNKLVVNCIVDGIDRGPTSAHPDFHQSHVRAPGFVENVILYNVKGFNCKCQGLFGLRLKNSAFVNVMFEKVGDSPYRSQYSGPMENVLFMHMNFYNQVWLWRGKGANAYKASDVSLYNNIFFTMGTHADGSTNGMSIAYNHFVSTKSSIQGQKATTGDVKMTDTKNHIFLLREDSPAYGTGRYLQCVPADIDGKPFDPEARNRGPYSKNM